MTDLNCEEQKSLIPRVVSSHEVLSSLDFRDARLIFDGRRVVPVPSHKKRKICSKKQRT